MQSDVTVQFWSALEVPHGMDAEMCVAHAKAGLPVSVRIARGNNAHTIHISEQDARSLRDQLNAICALSGNDAPGRAVEALKQIERLSRTADRNAVDVVAMLGDIARNALEAK